MKHISHYGPKTSKRGRARRARCVITAPTEEEQKSLLAELKIDEHPALRARPRRTRPTAVRTQPHGDDFQPAKNYSEKDKVLFKIGSPRLSCLSGLVIVTVT
ncbi:MAG: hypothetical protein IPJ35_11330 [Elusimicrobia bacterium]|nr:hypothetical protein [Elusimicrobiota bacterium]